MQKVRKKIIKKTYISYFFISILVFSSFLFLRSVFAYVVEYHIEIERMKTKDSLLALSIETGKPIVFYSFSEDNMPPESQPWALRTQYFLKKYLNTFSRKAFIVAFDREVLTEDDDYMSFISKDIGDSNIAVFVPNQISDIDSLYRVNFASLGIYFDNYWDVFFETKLTIEEILEPTSFDYRKFIRKSSLFPEYNNAVNENKKIIFIHMEVPHLSFIDIDEYEDNIRELVGANMYIIRINTIEGFYADPAVEALSKCQQSLFCIYNPASSKAFAIYPTGKEIKKEDIDRWVGAV